jgi:hypothetical protein
MTGTHAPAGSLVITDHHISDPATKPAVPTVKSDRPELRIKDESGLAHRNPQKEQYALRHVFMAVEHCMKDSERTLAALLIEMEDYNGSRRISVTCYDGAVNKAREIEAILFKAGKGLQGYSFIVHRKKGATTFGFRGPGSGHDWNNLRSDDKARLHAGNVYNVHHHSEYGYKDRTEIHRRREVGQVYANTMYWTPQSTMVDFFCAEQPSGNIAATPIRMQARLGDGAFATCTWTCGGIINVNGTNYGLTTAHPYVLSDAMRPNIPSRVKQSFEGKNVAGNFFSDDDVPETDDFFSMDQYPESYWQPIGKVSHYALAKIGSLPCNNDWLLIDLPKDRVMWNEVKGAISSDPDVLAVHTSRAVLVATLLVGSAHLVLGDSPFEVLKIGLSKPLRKYINVQALRRLDSLRSGSGDSGAWVTRGDELVGVIIAGDEDNPTDPVGFAISAKEIYRNISRSMNGLPVRQLTTLENKILAHKAMYGDSRPSVLAALHVRQLFSAMDNVGNIRNPLNEPPLTSNDWRIGNTDVTAFLRLGAICSSLRPGPALEEARPRIADSMAPKSGGSERGIFRWTKSSSQNTSKQSEDSLYWQLLQSDEGLAVIRLMLALCTFSLTSRTAQPTPNTAAAPMLFALMRELNISPLPSPHDVEVLVRSVRRHSILPIRAWIDLDQQKAVWLARFLARMIFALHTGRFFVFGGSFPSMLEKFVSAYYDEDVRIVTEDMERVEVNSTGSAEVYCTGRAFRVPRIFRLGPDRQTPDKQTSPKYNPILGDVVEYAELNDLLNNMKIELEGT